MSTYFMLNLSILKLLVLLFPWQQRTMQENNKREELERDRNIYVNQRNYQIIAKH